MGFDNFKIVPTLVESLNATQQTFNYNETHTVKHQLQHTSVSQILLPNAPKKIDVSTLVF